MVGMSALQREQNQRSGSAAALAVSVNMPFVSEISNIVVKNGEPYLPASQLQN